MKIEVQIKINQDLSQSDAANGWIEIEDMIKFPFRLRKYKDKKDGKEKTFITYPQRKTEEGYASVVYPANADVRKVIEEAVYEKFNQEFRKQMQLDQPTIESVRVTLLDQEPKGNRKVVKRGIASIKVAGLVINGILIKEGKKGLFVEMPRHSSGENYKDTVYATTSMAQNTIRSEVLYWYEKKTRQIPPVIEHPEGPKEPTKARQPKLPRRI